MPPPLQSFHPVYLPHRCRRLGHRPPATCTHHFIDAGQRMQSHDRRSRPAASLRGRRSPGSFLQHRHVRADRVMAYANVSHVFQRLPWLAAKSVEAHPTVLDNPPSDTPPHPFPYAIGSAASKTNTARRTGSMRLNSRRDARTMILAKKSCGIRWHDAGLLHLRPCALPACRCSASSTMHAFRESARSRHSLMQAADTRILITACPRRHAGRDQTARCWQASCMHGLARRLSGSANDRDGDVGNHARRNRIRPGRRSGNGRCSI